MKKVVSIVGPTGVGKTDLAFHLARYLGGVLISADSVQVFKGLDIISGKDLPQEYTYNAGYYSSNSGPSLFLLDVVAPDKQFTVTDFYHKAVEVIDRIHEEGKVPIIVGGTGLYVEAVLNGLTPAAPPNLALRVALNERSTQELQNMLPPEIFDQLNQSDKNNKRRLIRKIEIVKGEKYQQEKVSKYESLVIGLSCGRELLKERINKRVEARLQAGAIHEVERLYKDYENLTQQVKDANGYKQLFSYLKGEITYDESIYRWKISEYRHAKNQMTWFRKYGNVLWFDIEDDNFKEKIREIILKFLK